MNKLVKACIALAAFAAFAVLPGTASALNSAEVQAPTGTKLATGSKIIATGSHGTTGFTRLTDTEGNVLVECTSAEITGTLTKNEHSGVEGTLETAVFAGTPGVSTTGHCKGSLGNTTVTTSFAAGAGNGVPWCLQINSADTTDTFRVRGNACNQASRSVTFTLHIASIFGNIVCNYERTTFIPGTYTTHPNAAKASINKVEFKRHGNSSGFCPTHGLLDMEFTLYRETEGGVEDPLFIRKAT
jgi:hypothetical protein